MGLLYDVTYPGSVAMDRAVPWSYLQRLATAKSRNHNGAQAICINGPADVYVLKDGEWIDAPKTAERK